MDNRSDALFSAMQNRLEKLDNVKRLHIQVLTRKSESSRADDNPTSYITRRKKLPFYLKDVDREFTLLFTTWSAVLYNEYRDKRKNAIRQGICSNICVYCGAIGVELGKTTCPNCTKGLA